jgi:hypothetical protein
MTAPNMLTEAQVRITQLDGALPNLALARLAAWHRERGDRVHFSRSATPGLFEPAYSKVYGSALFSFTRDKLNRFKANFPEAVVGGTGSGSPITVESIISDIDIRPDLSHWPEFDASIGYTQRGCRLKCKFCVVPTKEGSNRSTSTLAEIWRGEPYPRHIHLLDNDFFGQESWRERIEEARLGKFKLCFSQGINVRLITDEVAEALAKIDFRDTSFNKRRLYTAWDNLKDEGVFFRGVDTLERAGIRPTQLMTYMLIGFDRKETWERIFHRFNRMVERGIDPYPMPYDQSRRDHKKFQRWVVTRASRNIPWESYNSAAKGRLEDRSADDLFALAAERAKGREEAQEARPKP